jgi:hypothetical protein
MSLIGSSNPGDVARDIAVRRLAERGRPDPLCLL